MAQVASCTLSIKEVKRMTIETSAKDELRLREYGDQLHY